MLPYNEGYIASGTLVSWNATQTGTRTYAGIVLVLVTKANHHASATGGSDVTCTRSDPKVAFG